MEKRQQAVDDDTDPYGHPRIPYRGYYDRDRCDLRRGWVEKFTSCSLEQVGHWWEGEGEEDSRSCLKLRGNIESPIGLVKVPVAIAGPLLVKGRHANGYVLVPCATTEGALVASVTRGAAALTRAGGVCTLASEKYMMRAPSFITRNAEEADRLWHWLRSHEADLQKQVKLCSQHATLVNLSPYRQGRTLVVRFLYTTGDACGQNMVTTATWSACKWALEQVEKELPDVCVKDFVIESLFSGDKQSTSSFLVLPRGVHVQAEAWIPESVLLSTLKVDLQTFLTGYYAMRDGQTHFGGVGSTVNVGNLLAAVFIATGQDVASLTECANGLLIVRPVTQNELETCGKMTRNHHSSPGSAGGGVVYSGVYVCLVIPGLVIGTVGGGTQLATQKECLSMMSCFGKDGVYRLAEIIAGFALGLDLSLISAVASGQFANAHEKLGRNRPSSGMKEGYLDKQFFQAVVGDRGSVDAWRAFDVNTGNSILSDLTKRELSKKVGHFGFHITYKTHDGLTQSLPVVMKSKPTDSEVCNMINKLAQGCGLKLAVLYEKFKMETDFRFCSQRELEICRLENPVLKQFMPIVYHTLLDSTKELYMIMMEYLSKENVCLFNTVEDVSVWTTDDIRVVLRDLAHMHSLYLSRHDWLSSQPWLERVTLQQMTDMAPLWRELMNHAHREFPQFWTAQRVAIVNHAVSNLHHIWTPIESAPHTLIHNDCNPRNICLRKSPYQNSTSPGSIPFQDPRTLCMYDWELATVGVPQYDVIEFLCFTLLPSTPRGVWLTLLEFYRQHLEYYSGVKFPPIKFLEVCHCCLFQYAMKRLALYTMAHTHKDYHYLPRVVDTLFSFLTEQIKLRDFSPSLHQLHSRL